MIPARTPFPARLAVSTGLVTVAVAASMLALTRVVLPGPWVGTGLAGVVLVGVAMGAVRSLVVRRRARLDAASGGAAGGAAGRADDGVGSAWPTVAGALVGLWYLLATFGGPTTAPHWFVGPGSLGELFGRLGEAGVVIREDIAPVIATHPMGLLCVGGALVVLVTADTVGTALRQPALAAAPVLVLWWPPLVLMGGVPGATFVVTVAALLLLLTLDGPVPRRRGPRDAVAAVRKAQGARAARTTATAAGVAAVALVAGGLTGGLPGIPTAWTDTFTTDTRTVRLSEDLDMYRSLTARSDEVVLRYTSSAGQNAGPLRVMTLSAFDGRDWRRGPDRNGQQFAPDEVLFPDDPPLAGERVQLDVTVGTLREDQLPVPVEPRDVATDGGWAYDENRDELVGGQQTQEGDTYVLGVHSRDLTPDRLREAPEAAAVEDAFLEVPATSHDEEIADMARDIVGDAATRYDQAVALQTYLRGPSFTYDTDVPRGRTGDPVWDFLEQRTGYCVQFATTMVILSRTLGIPARLAVGFLPGDAAGEGTWEVTGQDSHAWPELFFPGTGWVRFEPTPAVQTGAAPAYANPNLAAPAPVPTAAPEEVPSEQRPSAPAAAPSVPATPPAAASGGDAGFPVGAWVASAGGLVLVAAAFVLWLHRRRRSAAVLDAEQAWDRVVATLAARGIVLPTSTTPRRAPTDVAAALAERGAPPLAEDATEALVALGDAVEAGRYARHAAPLPPARLQELTAVVAAGLASSLDSAPPARVPAGAGV